ncbi:MAG: HypC/HybG/HupF family hydrogenase formation chaperone [Mycobacteriales bacterium]
MAEAAVATGLSGGLADDLAAASLALARRLSAGGTLWCASPAWPHHAQHVAVEFVHPVIVGKPALASVALSSHQLIPTARANLSSGDVLLVIATAQDPVARELVRRAPVWGAATLWIGAGERPEAGAADHVLWLPDDQTAAHDGSFILLYHLLWELSHVCLEHAGLLVPPADCDGPVCITCSDEGRLAEVVSASGSTARVRTADGLEDVDLSLVGAAAPDDLLVVHAGMAITSLAGPS